MQNVTIQAILNDKHLNLWGFHFPIPEEIAIRFKEGKTARIIATFNAKVLHHCAIMPSSQGPFIMLNKEIIKKLKIQVGDTVQIKIEKDISEYGMPIGEEFEAVVFGDEAVFQHFQNLTPGKRRNLIHLVNKVKNPDIKINRSMAIAQHLMETKGNINFKQLNEKIKEFNQRNKIR